MKEPYFFFKVIFQIQIKGKTKGSQDFEERCFLVKASSREQATSKVLKECKEISLPYLNAKGEKVRWKFESIEENFHTVIGYRHNFERPAEVFSKLKTRKLKKENIW